MNRPRSPRSNWLKKLGVDVASVRGWESGRRPLAALRAVDLMRLRSQFLRDGAKPTLLTMLEDAIQADLIIAETVQAGGKLIKTNEHPLGATVHQRKLTNLITWPFTRMAPAPLRDLVTARVRRGPVPNHPTLTKDQRTCFFDHLLVTADANPQQHASLLRRQAIYVAKRSICSASIRERARPAGCAQSSWAYWVGEIGDVEVDDEFMGRVDPRGWSGVRLLTHLLERLRPGSGHTELNVHTVWTLLLAHPALLSEHADLRSAAADTIQELVADRDLSMQARRELSDIAYAVRLAHR